MLDSEDIAEVMANAVKETTAPLLVRLSALEARELPEPRDGRDGLTGRDGKNGSNGEKGADGRHGLNADDVDLTVMEDGRTLEFSLKQGDIAYTFELLFPVPLYRGVYQNDAAYERGDVVTWAGSMWHCDKDTDDKPGGDDWTLCVKRGRDGKAGS